MRNATHENGSRDLFFKRPLKQRVQKRIQTALQYFFLKLHFLVVSNKRDVISALCDDVTQTILRKKYIICSNNVPLYQDYTYPNYC
jgi:hypothetical protein